MIKVGPCGRRGITEEKNRGNNRGHNGWKGNHIGTTETRWGEKLADSQAER